jgi:uncharacterized membrane protein YccC
MTTAAPDHAPKYAQLSLPDRIGKAMPMLLVPVLVVLGFLSIGSTSSWLTLTVSGLAMGMMIFIMASGLTLVFGLMDVINFGHGAFISVGAYVGISALLALESWTRRAVAAAQRGRGARRRDCRHVRHRRSGLGFRAGDRAAGLWCASQADPGHRRRPYRHRADDPCALGP